MSQTFVDYTVPNASLVTYSYGSRTFINPDYLQVYWQQVDAGGALEPVPDGDWEVTGVSGAASITLLGVTATSLTIGDKIRIRRETPVDAPIVDFQPGTLRSDDLDLSYLHTLNAAEESQELPGIEGAMVKKATIPDGWDAEDLPIKDLAQGVDATDAVTKAQLDAAAFEAGTLTYEESVRVETASPYSNSNRPRVIQHAQANSWQYLDEGWSIPYASSPYYQSPTWLARPLVEFHVPKNTAANGAIIEIRAVGEILTETDRCTLLLNTVRDLTTANVTAWDAGAIASATTLNGKAAPFETVMRLTPVGRYKTHIVSHTTLGAGQGQTQTYTQFVDATPDSGCILNLNAGALPVAGVDFFTLTDGSGTVSFFFSPNGTTPTDESEIILGLTQEETIKNIAGAIHSSRLRLRCTVSQNEAPPGTPTPNDWQIDIETIKGSDHMWINSPANDPLLTVDAGMGMFAGNTNFTFSGVATDSKLDWWADQDFFVSARRTDQNQGGVIVNAVSVLQHGCTKGWEPRS